MEEFLEWYAGISTIATVLQIVLAIFTIVTMWMVFAKAGEGGWKIFIPIYNEYVRFKIAGCKKRYWVGFVLSLFIVPLLIVGFQDIIHDIQYTGMFYVSSTTIVCALAVLAILATVCIIGITVSFKTAKAFGLPGVFGLGLWLLPIVFYAIIAFNGNIQYVGTGSAIR